MKWGTLVSIIALTFGCGGEPPPPPPASMAPGTLPPAADHLNAAPITTAPMTAPPPVAAPVTEPPPPKYHCTVFVVGGDRVETTVTMEDKAFKSEETTSNQMAIYGKVLAGDAMRRLELCQAFARRKCPKGLGDPEQCRSAITEGDTAEWDRAEAIKP